MNSKERILRVFNHREADRLLKDFGGTVVTSISKNAYIKMLNNYYGDLNPCPCSSNDLKIIDMSMSTVLPSEEILKRLNVDFRLIAAEDKPYVSDNKYFTSLGIGLKKVQPFGYFDVIYNPLKDLDIDQIRKYKWPRISDPDVFKELQRTSIELYENTKYGIVGQVGPLGFYEKGQMLRGYEQFGVDLMLNREIVREIFDNLLIIQKEVFEFYLNYMGKYLDVIFYADDLGMQDRPQISPEMYRSIIKPYHKEIFHFIKQRTDAKIFLHSCGDIYPFLEDLIDAGVDIINPIQVSAREMEPKKLKEEFGDRLIFWGGIDEQFLINKATMDEVLLKVKETVQILGKDGGYIAAISHNVQEDTPAENVIAIFDYIESL
jgi:uroporphyrinogen decarboxylase